MISRHLKKQTGYNLIEIGHVANVFRRGDPSHPHLQKSTNIWRNWFIKSGRRDIYQKLTLEERGREVALGFHSEKLAVAFGIMSTREVMLIEEPPDVQWLSVGYQVYFCH